MYPDPPEEDEPPRPFDENDYEYKQERYEKDMDKWIDPDEHAWGESPGPWGVEA